MGQFTGNTHGTKTKDLEESIRKGVASFQTSPEADRRRNVKALRRLGERLLASRIRTLRAQIAAARPENEADAAARFEAKVSQLEADGVRGVLADFGFNVDAPGPTEGGSGTS